MHRDPAPIPLHERLIFALDVDSFSAAKRWIDSLDDAVGFYKIGMELLATGEYFRVLELLAARDKAVFVDLKFHDVPATVAAAVRRLTQWPVRFCTLHSYAAMLRAASEVKGDIRLLAVTVLTSMDAVDLRAQGVLQSPAQAVLDRALGARASGCDGVIASGLEAAAIRAATSDDFLIVCPGIRALSERGLDDQKRTLSAGEAIAAGADHIVVGRPIRAAADPRAAAFAMRAEIEAALIQYNQ
ncbi:MAG: orotidine-5'-phosphate decarboxylase [Pseudomarimonas sp.]